jgi:hypothetical protein
VGDAVSGFLRELREVPYYGKVTSANWWLNNDCGKR